ncbi:type II secretion system protein G [Elusimicrobium simillimum]|uniref:type IV pilin protein n=1 Tax=Elusimicrobium simillimum TaxID=3143438 RepID=UPI003C6FD04B
MKDFQSRRSAAKMGGFTLIELLVVVLIIGILAAIALPQYTKAVEKSRAAEALVVLKSMQDAVDIFFMENGENPTSVEDLSITVPGTVVTKTFGGDYDTKANGCSDTKNFLYCINSSTSIHYFTGTVFAISNKNSLKLARLKDGTIYCSCHGCNGGPYEEPVGKICKSLGLSSGRPAGPCYTGGDICY